MKNLFVSYEIAVTLKKNGFNEPCFRYFLDQEIIINGMSNNLFTPHQNSNGGGHISAPLFQQVIDWLEVKGVSIWAYPVYRAENIAFFKVNMAKYYAEIDTEELFGLFKDTFNTKEEALNKAIEEGLKLIKK